jgi:hypothetical protein
MELQLAVQPNSSAFAQFFSARRHSLLCCAFRKALGKPEEMGVYFSFRVGLPMNPTTSENEASTAEMHHAVHGV